MHFKEERRKFSIEFLFSVALINAGIIQILNLPWLKLAYFPFIISIAAFYSWETIISVSVLIPFLILKIDLKNFILVNNLAEEGAFSGFLILTAITSSYIYTSLKKEKDTALSSLDAIKDNAMEITRETSMESLSNDEAISHYFASMLKTDEEIKELLLAIKKAVFADSANFFVPHHSSFMLRCSTEKKGDIKIKITDKGIIQACLKEKKIFYAGDINEKGLEVGYIKSAGISSVLAIPVIDGSTFVGILTVDSSRFQAFSEPDRNTVQMLTAHLARILERERIYPKIKRDYNGLQILKEESSKLIASLDINIIVEKLCEGAKRIVSSEVFFFLAEGKKFGLMYDNGVIAGNLKLFNLTGTVINMVTENKQPFYLSDVKNYRVPLMPLETNNISSMMVIPLLYENNLLGLLAMLSGQARFLDSFQTELLKVMCNQAATSIANARLHAEIKQLATTDGLTGLLNHRIFQEKLTGELKRLKRSNEPTSLILTDIDYFKKVNDSYGHPVGDLVLKGVAKIINETIRDIDIPARYGGEEFAVILPGTDSKGVKNIAERLRKAVMDKSFSTEGKTFKVTISVGIATSPADAKSKEELIEKTDQALYRAKKNGRNQSVLWSEIRE